MRTGWIVFAVALLVGSGCHEDVAMCSSMARGIAARAYFAQSLVCCKRGCAINDDQCGSGMRYVKPDATLGDCVDRLSDCVRRRRPTLWTPDLSQPRDLAALAESAGSEHVPGDLLMSTVDSSARRRGGETVAAVSIAGASR